MKKRYKKSRFPVIALLVLLAITVGVIVFAIIIKNNSKEKEKKSDFTVSTEVISTQEQQVYEKTGDFTVKLSDGTSDFSYSNADKNGYYAKLTIKLAESKQVIYESEMIAPGKEIKNAKLTLPDGLAAGLHNVKIYIDSYKDAQSDSSHAVIRNAGMYVY